MMRIEDDAGLAELIRSEQEERIGTGFTFTEGPVWVAEDRSLLFSDIPNNTIHRWRPGQAGTAIVRRPSQHSNGLTLDHQGRLLACEHFTRRVTRGALDGTPLVVLADRYDGRRLNSPNDIVVHASGAIYFTDPIYGLRDHDGDQQQPCQGVYRLDPNGALRRVEESFTNPNGLAFSPDQSFLYIGDSEDLIVKRFRVTPDGGVTDGEIFVDMRDDGRAGVPDGMKVDEAGRLWTTGAGGVWVVEPDGRRLGVLALPEYPANLTFGGPDFASLFLTSWTSVYRVETAVRGIAPGSRI